MQFYLGQWDYARLFCDLLPMTMTAVKYYLDALNANTVNM